jgi:hypothetical protein
MPDKTSKTPKIPSFEEAQNELGEDAMSFFIDMIRQDDRPPEENEE